MPSRLTIRFYSVEKLNPNGLSLKRALEQLDALEFPARERQLMAGLTVRLERYADDAGELAGEFTRVRTTNFPFEVRPDGAARLPTNGPIGDGVVFRFRPADHTLAIQYDTRIVSPGRAMDYLMQFDNRGAFKITPKMDEENWRKFRESPVRKLKIGIASPDHLGNIEDEGAAVARSFQELSEAYGAPVITIEMGMGNRLGALGDATKGLARAMADLFRGGEADLRSLRAKVKPNEDMPAEDINLIDEIISDKFELELPQNDPDRSYAVRSEFLKNRLRQHGNNQ